MESREPRPRKGTVKASLGREFGGPGPRIILLKARFGRESGELGPREIPLKMRVPFFWSSDEKEED